MGRKFSEMVSVLMPGDLPLSELKVLAPKSLWERNDYMATAYALRKHDRINWQAYVERYSDVKASGMDACLHFLRYGVYENRKLVSIHPLQQKHPRSNKLISVIIVTYNNEGYLERCLRSVVDQTLKNIEIVVIDDCSTDRSRNILSNFAKSDPRFKLIFKEKSEGLFMAKKMAVGLATGTYIMFLDANSHIIPDGCETAYRYIAKGYDAISFCINSRSNTKIYSENDMYRQFYDLNGVELGTNDIKNYISKNIDINYLYSKVIISDIVKQAFSCLPDIDIDIIDDLVITIAILKHLRHAFKINHVLCHHSEASGDLDIENSISNEDKSLKIAKTCKFLENFINDKGLVFDFNYLKEYFCNLLVTFLFSNGNLPNARKYWDAIVNSFGFNFTLQIIIKYYWDNLDPIARKLPDICYSVQAQEPLRNIAIKCAEIDEVGSIFSVVSMATCLQDTGANVLVFVQDDSNSHKLPAGLRVIPQPAAGDSAESHLIYAQTLITDIKLNHISCIFNFDADKPASIWDIIICNYFDIPHIAVLKKDIFWLVSHLHYGHSHHFYTYFYKCYSSIISYSKIAEAYYRLQNINAISLPISVGYNAIDTNRNNGRGDIIYAGDFRDSETCPNEILPVLVDILKCAPETHLHIVGEFRNELEYKNLLAETSRLELTRYVSITPGIEGWLATLRQCDIFISTAFWTGPPIFLAQALAFGLPCVVYDIPLDSDIDCEAVIRVRQGDSFRMAMEVVDLRENQLRLQNLAEVGRRKASRLTIENCKEKFGQFLQTFLSSCPYTPYGIGDYKKLMKYMVWYNQHRQF